LRNSVNTQWTIGAISKANYKVNDAFQTLFGVDWRTAEIEHFREVRDLLGGEYWIKTADEFNPDQRVGLGDRIDYNFTNTVDWIGFFGQGEYKKDLVSAYGMAGYSIIKYNYTNHFRDDGTGKETTAETDWISGAQVKGGASYRLRDDVDIFANAGYVSKVPIFDDVINDRTGTKAEDPKNEKFTSIEGGANYRTLAGKVVLKGNFYYTMWKDKSNSIEVINPDGSEGIVFIQGTDLVHAGVEFEGAYQPHTMVRLDAAASVGNWKYTDDVSGVYKDYSGGGAQDVEYDFYIKDLKSGNAPQTQFSVSGSVFPTRGLLAQLVFRYYANHYADWDPFSRTDPDDRAESWKAPNYGVLDFHATYDLPFDFSGVRLQLFAHVFNVLDAEYIQDAIDNSAYNSWDDDHDADDAEVFFGLPRFYNVGLTVSLR
jgi:iron complex outermembrane receptor protein